MVTEEQAKKEIVDASLKLRGILIQRPMKEYPSGLYQHSGVKKQIAKIEFALALHSTLPRDVYTKDTHLPAPTPQCFGKRGGLLWALMTCNVLPLEQIPADWETLKWLDQYLEDFGGTVPDELTGISLTPEGKTILEALADEHPMTVTQESLVLVTRLSDRTVRKHLSYLRDNKLVNKPHGPRKGDALTAKGLALIKRQITTG